MASAAATSLVPENVACRSIGIARDPYTAVVPAQAGTQYSQDGVRGTALPHAKSEFTGSAACAGDDTEGNERGPTLPACEKLDQRGRRRLRRLLGEIVPAVERKSAHIARPFAPGRERALGLGRDAAG